MNKTLRLIIFVIALLPVITISAKGNKHRERSDNPDKDRQEWMQKMTEYKHSFLVSELDLSQSQSEEFFKIYDQMESERFAADRKVRSLQKEVLRKNSEPTEKQLDDCIAAQYELTQTMADIDRKYEAALRKVLTKRQLCKLPLAERNFQHKLMESRRECPPPPTK